MQKWHRLPINRQTVIITVFHMFQKVKCKHAKKKYGIYEKTKNKCIEMKNAIPAIKIILDRINSRLQSGKQNILNLKTYQ